MAKRNTPDSTKKPRGRVDDDPRIIARIAELAQAGQTQEGIAIQLEQDGLAKISRAAVGWHLRRLEERGTKIERRRRADPRRPASKGAAPGAANGQPPAADVAEAGQRAPAGAPPPGAAKQRKGCDPIEMIEDDIAELDGVIAAALQHGNITNYASLRKQRLHEIERLIDLKPPPPPDPEQDPAAIAARQRLMAMVRRLVERHEADEQGDDGAPGEDASSEDDAA